MAFLERITRANCRLNDWFFPKEQVRYVRRFRELAADISRDAGVVLHLGSGPVDLSPYVGNRGQTTSLINLDLGLQDLQKNLGAWKVCADAEELPFRENQFGAICSEHVFEHFAAPERALTECYRILKPGGRLVVSGPNGRSYIALAARLTSLGFHNTVRRLNRKGNEECPEGFHTLYRFSTPGTIRRLALKSGFEVRAMERFVGEPCYTTFLPVLHLLFIAYHLVLERLCPRLGFHITAVTVLRKPTRHTVVGLPRLPLQQTQLRAGAR